MNKITNNLNIFAYLSNKQNTRRTFKENTYSKIIEIWQENKHLQEQINIYGDRRPSFSNKTIEGPCDNVFKQNFNISKINLMEKRGVIYMKISA